MCGIVGYVGGESPKDILIQGLKRLEYRGYDSAGIAIQNHEGTTTVRSEGRIDALVSKLKSTSLSGNLGVGHTRWATHGAPIEKNAHPHTVGKITIVHNGIIENYLDHRDILKTKGKDLLSDTDTEIVAHLIEAEVSHGKNLLDAVITTTPRLRGSYAFVVSSDSEPGVLVGVRNGAPLLLGLGKEAYYIASDVQAILDRTNKVVYLNDGDIVRCTRAGFTIIDSKGKKREPQVVEITWSPDELEKHGFEHYMLKEIHEQPRALLHTIEGNLDIRSGVIKLAELGLSENELKQVSRVVIAACGTARHAALVGKFYIEQFAGIPVEVDFASEFRYRNPVLSKDTLTIFVSQSGETADTLGALREANQFGARTISICNVRDSTIAREANLTLYTNAGPEIGVASTKAFTTQLAVLYMLAVQLGFLKKHITEEQSIDLTEKLRRLPNYLEATLGVEKSIQQLVEEIQTLKLFLYIGRGIVYPIALEGALKLKEISYLHAYGYPAGELKHGPIALVEQGLVTVALAPTWDGPPPPSSKPQSGLDPAIAKDKILSNIEEVKSRGGKIVTFGSENDSQLRERSSFYAPIPTVDWGMTPIVTAIPVQLLAYYMAKKIGTDIDKPRNLAKSVTVE